jgi:hypothetical protein
MASGQPVGSGVVLELNSDMKIKPKKSFRAYQI